jgi:hypothetical protein
MALILPTAIEVDDFIAVPKTFASSGTMDWRPCKGAPGARQWRATLESDGVIRGEVMLYANLAVERWWNFHLLLRGHAVFGWHLKPGERHKNRKACGEGFITEGRRIKTPHEQSWLPGHGLCCAVSLEGLNEDTHEQVFGKFARRTNLDLGTLEYRFPVEGEQMRIHEGDPK